MTSRSDGRNELDAASTALELIARYVAGGKDRFDISQDRKLAPAFLWANIGSQFKQFCRHREIPIGTEPFAGPIQMRDRLVYGPIGSLDPEIIWDICIINGPGLHELVTKLRSTL